jgi:hypothetical protein
MLATVSEELGPRLSIGGVELERLALLGKCPSAPLGKNDRAVRGDPRGGHTCWVLRRGIWGCGRNCAPECAAAWLSEVSGGPATPGVTCCLACRDVRWP